MVMPKKKESLRKARKAELEALSDDELRGEIEKASPQIRRAALKMAVGWLRVYHLDLLGDEPDPAKGSK